MADPITATILTVVTAVASVASGFAESSQLREDAQTERNIAAEEAERTRRDIRRRLGQSRANVGASGVQVEGSPLEVLSDIAAEGELDAQTVKFQGDQRAKQLERRADSALIKGFTGAGTALAGGTFGGFGGGSAATTGRALTINPNR